MSKTTKIQWCDSTENPVMGCDGCPLYPSTTAEVVNRVGVTLAAAASISMESARLLLKATFNGRPFSQLYKARKEIAVEVATAPELGQVKSASEVRRIVEEGIASSLRCYAGLLHARWGENPVNPGRPANAGYALRFEEVTRFSKRTLRAAAWSDLAGTARPLKPWLDGFPRLIFVSDMGDALSSGVPQQYLKEEIVDVANSEKGKAHVWLWLTKRPRAMAKFSEWLEKEGIAWPRNLVPMTSVLDRSMASQIQQLKRIPAMARGLSVEPLWEDLDLDLDGIDWVIVGGESGAYAKPFDLAWARKLRDRCRSEGKAFFMKQLGAKPIADGRLLTLADTHGGDWNEWPTDLRVRELPKVFRKLAIKRTKRPRATRRKIAH